MLNALCCIWLSVLRAWNISDIVQKNENPEKVYQRMNKNNAFSFIYVNLLKVNASSLIYVNLLKVHAFSFIYVNLLKVNALSRGRPRKAAEACGYFVDFRRFKTTFFYLCFCFVCYAVQSSSRPYKTLSPFLGGGVKAIPWTALLLSKIPTAIFRQIKQRNAVQLIYHPTRHTWRMRLSFETKLLTIFAQKQRNWPLFLFNFT